MQTDPVPARCLRLRSVAVTISQPRIAGHAPQGEFLRRTFRRETDQLGEKEYDKTCQTYQKSDFRGIAEARWLADSRREATSRIQLQRFRPSMKFHVAGGDPRRGPQPPSGMIQCMELGEN